MAQNVVTSTFYMDRDDKYLVEKPYELKFPPPEGFAATNTAWSKYENIAVTDVRGKEDEFTVQKNGFQLCHLRTMLNAAEFRTPKRIEEVFLKEVAHVLKDTLKATRVLVFDYNLRVSVPGFPISTGEPVAYQTPATIVHIDTTDDWTRHMHSIYEDKLDGIHVKSRFQYVNLWKPIKGPVKRWPLMLCDWNTYDVKRDVIARDLVYTDGQLETFVAFYNPTHKYHYLSNQREDEAWVMVQCDSVHGKGESNVRDEDDEADRFGEGVLHTAFPSPFTVEADPERESIEVRCMAYFDD